MQRPRGNDKLISAVNTIFISLTFAYDKSIVTRKVKLIVKAEHNYLQNLSNYARI